MIDCIPKLDLVAKLCRRTTAHLTQTQQKMNTKKLLLFTTSLVFFPYFLTSFNTQQAQAGCGWLDPTCHSGPNDCLFGACVKPSTSVFNDPKPTPPVLPKPSTRTIYYSFNVTNSTDINIVVHININEESHADDRVVVLSPGESKAYAFTQSKPAVIGWASSVDNHKSHTYVMPLDYGYPTLNRFMSTTNGIDLFNSSN
jgi:hypothetical protein